MERMRSPFLPLGNFPFALREKSNLFAGHVMLECNLDLFHVFICQRVFRTLYALGGVGKKCSIGR